MANSFLSLLAATIKLVGTAIWYVFVYVLFYLFFILSIACLLIAGIVMILLTSCIKVFKRILYYINDKSFELSVLVMTTLVGYYQIPIIPFRIYMTLFSVLVILKWLRGRECGILKDKVCYVMYRLNLQWVFRNFSVVGIKLHGCHPVSKIVFENSVFLIHEGTRIVNPNVPWATAGVWAPDQLDRNIWRFPTELEPIEFPVDKGPLDRGYQHCYRVMMQYKNSLLRYWVHYIEISKDSAGVDVDNARGCTDDFIIKMSETQVSRFYCYVDMLQTKQCALISTLDDMCHCETMQDVAKLIVKGDDFYMGVFQKPNSQDPETRTFC